MLAALSTQYMHIFLLTAPLLLYMKPRYTPLTTTIIVMLYLHNHNSSQTTLHYQLSAILAILCCLKHNRRYIGTSILWFLIFSFGILVNGILIDNQIFLTQLISHTLSNELLSKYLSHITIFDFLQVLSLWMLIGIMPFSKRIMHLFAISNNFFKTICFIMPMFFLQIVIQQNIDTKITEWFGLIISIHAGMLCMLKNTTRHVFTYMMVYFYGLNTATIAQNREYIDIFNSIWLMLCIAVFAYTNIVAPKRTQIYFIYESKTSICSTTINKILSLWFYIILLSILTVYITTNNSSLLASYWAYLCVIALFIGFTAKIFYILLFTQPHPHQTKNTEQNSLKKSIKTATLFSFTAIAIIYTIFNTPRATNTPSSKQILYIMIFLLTIFFVSLLLSKLLIIPKKSTLVNKTQRNYAIQAVLDGLKVVIDIIYISITDFFHVIKYNAQQILTSSAPTKLTNLLSNNKVYFYIFFLVEIIIVLTIECVIT